MPDSSRRRNVIIIVLLALLALILLLLVRCRRQTPVAEGRATPAASAPAAVAAVSPPPASAPETKPPDEVLTPATLQAPAQVVAGAAFSVAWTGPDNPGDYVTLVLKDAPANSYATYRETRDGRPLELTAPIEPGDYELRYVAARSVTILGRTPLIVTPITATLNAAAEVLFGTTLSIEWTGPNNHGDYITLVPKDLPDGQYGNYTYTTKGSPLSVIVPAAAGEAEIRYMTGQGAKVLGRRDVRITPPVVELSASVDAIAGSSLKVTWEGPNNSGDYITVVPRDKPDGQYGNYAYTTKGSPLEVLVPIMTGDAEIRYMSGQGAKVLARRPLTVVAAEVSLSAPMDAAVGSAVPVTWTGPNYPGDYLTVVAKEKPDNQYGNYTYTTKGSPLTVVAPKEPGDAEVRYLAGQGNKVLARRTIRITR